VLSRDHKQFVMCVQEVAKHANILIAFLSATLIDASTGFCTCLCTWLYFPSSPITREGGRSYDEISFCIVIRLS